MAASPVALTDQTVAAGARKLARRDPDLARVFRKLGPPPLWARPAGFSTLIKIILEQQVSLASAASLFARVNAGITPFRPARVLELGEPYLKTLGLTRQKTAYCLALADALETKQLRLSQLTRMSDDEVRNALTSVKGIGLWSADVYLLMVLRRPDVFPVNDLALVTAVTKLKRLPERPSSQQFLELAERWRPYRSVAARMLWQFYLAKIETDALG